MKELAKEYKAKAYDEAYKKVAIRFGYNVADEIFPELAESEDERIRKEMIEIIKNEALEFPSSVIANKSNSWIAWLEKQGEQKPTEKVEPKFHKGEWLCENEPNNYARFIQILEIVNVQGKDRYRISRDIHKDEDVAEFRFVEKYYHKFDIQDAKDGDVLTYVTDEEDLWIMIYWSLYEPYEGHVHYHALLVNDDFTDKGTCCICIDNLKPATKEQRDTLMKAMTDAGYTFDFEKKELKKVEQKQDVNIQINPEEYINDMGGSGCYLKNTTQASTWSEEDEKMFKDVIKTY